MLIRPMEGTDIPAAARLLHELASEFIVDEFPVEGACTFLRENDEDGIRGYIARGHIYHVAYVGDELAGFVAVRDGSHLFHMFVDKRWHRQGVARRLWDVAREAALAAGNPGVFTVNSSLFAQPLYHALGFVPTGPVQHKKGVTFQPMELRLAGGDAVPNAPRQPGATTGC
jgi:GNAT superfamily N-acetyltransferase